MNKEILIEDTDISENIHEKLTTLGESDDDDSSVISKSSTIEKIYIPKSNIYIKRVPTIHKNIQSRRKNGIQLPPGVEELYEPNHFIHDWSKESCDDFFEPVNLFLSNQLQRENSSKRRCKEVVKSRNLQNNRNYIDEKLKEYDEKISLNLLLKKNKEISPPVSHILTTNGLNNYRALIAEEIVQKNLHCDRCVEKNRKYDDNFLQDLLDLEVKNRGKSKKKLKLPNLNTRTAFTSSKARSNIPSSINEHARPFGSHNDSHVSLNYYSTTNFLKNKSDKVISKIPMEIKKKNLIKL